MSSVLAAVRRTPPLSLPAVAAAAGSLAALAYPGGVLGLALGAWIALALSASP